MMLPINEVFETFQGEATWTGTPAVFLRLQGCGVGCPWCDTKHTWELDPSRVIPVGDMLDKVLDAATYALMSPEAIVAVILSNFRAKHIVITGGEPCAFDLTELTGALIAAGRRVQIETSGTQEVRVHGEAFVTVSPKISMPGGYAVRADALARADEIKLPVGKLADVQRLDGLLKDAAVRPRSVWLQPLSQSPKATELCLAVALERDWRVSIQTHKFLGVR